MTEPDAGSDLKSIKTTARRDGSDYIIDGSKTFISSGQNADFVIVAAKTDASKGAKGISLIIVPADAEGFRKGRKQLDQVTLTQVLNKGNRLVRVKGAGC